MICIYINFARKFFVMYTRTFKAALFDLDGVVFDTEPQYTVFWGNQFRRYYPEYPGMEQQIKGMTLVEIYEKYFPKKDQQDQITKELNDFEENMKFLYVEDFEKFVADIRSNGVRTAVVTSSNKEKMQNVYSKHKEFKGFFDAILTAEDFAESKPSPDCYQRAAARLGLTKEQCVVFEDSFNGLKSGRAADMFVVGLSTTNAADAIMPYSDIVISNYKGIGYKEISEKVLLKE